jgi:DNA-binding PadR family transcriptional regulator
MRSRVGFHGPRPGRVLGLYALAAMERDGPTYGYLLSERVAERTEGAWRPGAGAVYPALTSLTERGFARALSDKGRRMYTITPAGRRFLASIRSEWMRGADSGPDLSRLWAEIAGSGDAGQHVLRHLRRHLESAAAIVERDPTTSAGNARLADQLLADLKLAETRVAHAVAARRPSPTRTRRRAK